MKLDADIQCPLTIMQGIRLKQRPLYTVPVVRILLAPHRVLQMRQRGGMSRQRDGSRLTAGRGVVPNSAQRSTCSALFGTGAGEYVDAVCAGACTNECGRAH